MRDQCQRCNTMYSIPSAIVSSDFSEEENQATMELVVAGHFKILYIAPERLSNALWQAYVSRMRISMIVIDEAHCISTWGHDFRPHYRRIVRLLSAHPKNVPILALTATANKRVEQDVLQQIGEVTQVVRGTMQRPNLHLNVETLIGDQEKLSYLAEILPYYPGTGIIYTATKSSAEMLATFLIQRGINADYYHAGREDTVRQDIEQKLMSNQYKVVCSTNALGMGIDKPDVRFVIHYHIPASPIHYYQEMGRAGRDRKVSWCILLYDPTDVTIQEYFIRNERPEGKYYDVVLSLLRIKDQGLRESNLMLTTGLSQKATRNILADLEEQRFIEHNPKSRTYTAISRLGQIDFSAYDEVRLQKLQELSNIQNYVRCDTCYMEYLTTYLGDEPGSHCRQCGRCRKTNFPPVTPSRRIQGTVAYFLEEGFLPRIEKRPEHEAGWSLSFHGNSRTGRLVRASKYENAGPFAPNLVNRVVKLVRTRYPIDTINEDLQEQSCWLLLAFESGLSTRIINDILVVWCKQLGRTLQEFFATSKEEWIATCHLKTEIIQKLEQAKEKLVGQAFLVEKLSHEHIHLLTVFDENYPRLLKLALNRNQLPPVLCYAGDLQILERETIGILASRNAGP